MKTETHRLLVADVEALHVLQGPQQEREHAAVPRENTKNIKLMALVRDIMERYWEIV